jgi:hypothetical protein
LAVDVPPHCSAAVESQGQIGFTKQKIGFVILEKRRKMGSFDSFAIKFLTVSEFVFQFFFRVAPSGPSNDSNHWALTRILALLYLLPAVTALPGCQLLLTTL